MKTTIEWRERVNFCRSVIVNASAESFLEADEQDY